ncbi:MAG: Bug family tripartite tricarboxylate transporter substrate binding protein [Hyphomicrobiaceae bacterium]
MISRRETLGLGVSAAAALVAGPVAAQIYPDRPVNLIVMAPAGGSTDVGARIVAAIAEKQFGQPIVVVNKVGAGGQVGWTELARSRPDGYTIGFLVHPGMNTVVLDPDRQAIFNLDSFVPIISQVLDPGLVWVRADSPIKSFRELLEEAKAKPHTVTASTTGILSDDHLNVLMAEEAMPGAFFRIVHLDGGAVQLKEGLAGNIVAAFDNVGGAMKAIKAGQARALVVTDTERSKFLPDVPTSVELGFPTVISSSARGIVAPKGTPPAAIKKLTEVLEQAMKDPEHGRRLDEQGLGIKVLVGDAYAAFYREVHEKARKYTAWAKQRPQK